MDCVLSFLDSDNKDDVFWTVVFLGELKDRRFKDELENLLNDEDLKDVHQAISRAIGNIPKPGEKK